MMQDLLIYGNETNGIFVGTADMLECHNRFAAENWYGYPVFPLEKESIINAKFFRVYHPEILRQIHHAYHALPTFSAERYAEFRQIIAEMESEVQNLEAKQLKEFGWDCTNKYHRQHTSNYSSGMPNEHFLRFKKPQVYFQGQRHFFTEGELHPIKVLMDKALAHKEQTAILSAQVEQQVSSLKTEVLLSLGFSNPKVTNLSYITRGDGWYKEYTKWHTLCLSFIHDKGETTIMVGDTITENVRSSRELVPGPL